MKRMTVLITDAEYKNALAITRALGRKGLTVYTAGKKNTAQTFYSKYSEKHFVYSHPQRKPEQFKKEILAIVKRNEIEVLMPVGIGPCTLISQEKEKLEKFTKVPLATYDVFQRVHNKEEVNRMAVKNNIPAPLTIAPKNIQELKKGLKKFQFPVVIKARKGSSTRQVRYAKSKDEALTIWKEFTKQGKDDKTGIIDRSQPLIQEYLPGEIIDVVFIFNKGEPRGVVSQRRELTFPVSGGSGALNRTVFEPKVIQNAIKLLKAFKWHGVGMAEFKRDKNGVAKIIEVNPKFWGTTECAISAGMNFPHMLYELAVNGDTKPHFRFLNNKPFGWPIPMGMNTALNSKYPLKVLFKYLRLLGYAYSTDIALLDDPKPFAIQLQNMSKIILQKFSPKNFLRKLKGKNT